MCGTSCAECGRLCERGGGSGQIGDLPFRIWCEPALSKFKVYLEVISCGSEFELSGTLTDIWNLRPGYLEWEHWLMDRQRDNQFKWQKLWDKWTEIINFLDEDFFEDRDGSSEVGKLSSRVAAKETSVDWEGCLISERITNVDWFWTHEALWVAVMVNVQVAVNFWGFLNFEGCFLHCGDKGLFEFLFLLCGFHPNRKLLFDCDRTSFLMS